MTTDDLPAGIGAPATRALHQAGYHRLPELDGVSRASLAALHGVGPKALRILAEALDARGLSLTA
ncbi:DNA-binding protein [Actinoplanes sp. NPDC026623]|uniref:DNA-binding protein n=1 Tax=Actinoplanes sp. NPDC026623 TaxID=3155610 RepID=UPI0033CBC5C1